MPSILGSTVREPTSGLERPGASSANPAAFRERRRKAGPSMERVTISVMKAAVGSIGGHTKPSDQMLNVARARLEEAILGQLILDGLVTYTGDDIVLTMSHKRGLDSPAIHTFAWQCFVKATNEAQAWGLYGAGQDLRVSAPARNLRGAGPGVAEIEFALDPASAERPSEAFLVFAGDKCGPGAFNYPLYSVFCDPMHNSGLLLNSKLHRGFIFTIIDLEQKAKDGDRIICLEVPERGWDVACLLQNPDRFVVEAIHSRYLASEQTVAVSATRLHNVAGEWTGKDDPVAIIRTQGIFPASDDVLGPFLLGHYVGSNSYGSHVMPIMPVALSTPVCGPFRLPTVSCAAFSMSKNGMFSRDYVDMFGNAAWDATRLKVQEKAEEWRRQGFISPAVASPSGLASTGFTDTLAQLEQEFTLRRGEELLVG